MTQTDWPFDENVVPINEAAIPQSLVDAIMNATVSGPVMTLEEFMAWLHRQ
jgi:hypothetical protein